MLHTKRVFKFGMVLAGAIIAMPTMAPAQGQASTESASAEDPNDKAAHERSFEETRRHMQAHSEWSKKTGKMDDH